MTKHVGNVFKDGELDEKRGAGRKRQCANFAHPAEDGNTYQVEQPCRTLRAAPVAHALRLCDPDQVNIAAACDLPLAGFSANVRNPYFPTFAGTPCLPN